MLKYLNTDLAQLAHQLTLSPRRQRPTQIAGAQRLLELIKSGKDYPYDFVCFHLTGYRPLRPSSKPAIHGNKLISDLVRLVEHLSQSASIPLSALSEPVFTQEQLSQRLSVSLKTISRWRKRGLSGLRAVDQDGVSRLVFTERSLQRFVAGNRDLVLRGGSFRQLTDVEREGIIARARQLVSERRMKLQDVARTIAAETSRAVETIRYTLRRHDQTCGEAALFGPAGRPMVPTQYSEILQARRSGTPIAQIAQQRGLSRKKTQQICNEMTAYELLSRKIECVYQPEYDAPEAERHIVQATEPQGHGGNGKRLRPSSDAPAYLKALYRVPLLNQEQERDLFRRYNFHKYRARTLLAQLEPCRASARQLGEVERQLELADGYQNRIIKANLRLVVSIANRHFRPGINMSELISDGNISLMRAVERFDYSRGFKFSTYASWAIMKNYARTIPEERYRYTRYVTGKDELLDATPDSKAPAIHQPSEAASIRTALAKGLSKLDEREREILTSHFGLGGQHKPTTLEQLGERFGVTKERIRQIEKRALAKLRAVLPVALSDYSAGE